MIIPTNELNAVSDQPAPLQLFGYSQVDEAVNLVNDMLIQELRQFAERLKPAQMNRLFDVLLILVADDAPVDPERDQRIWKMVKSIMADDVNAQNWPESTEIG
jgi:hypothetical protein